MAQEYSLFFDSVAQDRVYMSAAMAEFFSTYFSNGVGDYDTDLIVTAGDGMSVNVGYGNAVVNGYGYWLKDNGTGGLNLPVTAADAQPRIDRVVLRADISLDERRVYAAVKQGTPAANPVAPELTRSGNIYELSLARFRVPANAISISAENIADERREEALCGLMLGKYVAKYVNQNVRTDGTPTFQSLKVNGTVEAERVIGAVYQ